MQDSAYDEAVKDVDGAIEVACNEGHPDEVVVSAVIDAENCSRR